VSVPRRSPVASETPNDRATREVRSSGPRITESARYYRGLLVGEVGRLVYGNDAGIMNNVRGRARTSAARGSTPAMLDPTAHTTAAARALSRNGWVHVPPTVDAAAIACVRDRCEELLEDPAHSVELGSAPRVDAVSHVIDPVANVPELATLLSGEAVETLRTAYGAELEVLHVRAWRIVPDEIRFSQGRFRKRPVSVMGNLLHNDAHPVCWTKYFVQLSPDVNAETGALRLLPIATTKRAMRRGFLRPNTVIGPARRVITDTKTLVVFDGPPGSGLLCNTERCLHAAGIPRAGSSRLMLQFTLAPSPTPLRSDWAATLQPDHEVLKHVR
jgi:hypothetical protein